MNRLLCLIEPYFLFFKLWSTVSQRSNRGREKIIADRVVDSVKTNKTGSVQGSNSGGSGGSGSSPSGSSLSQDEKKSVRDDIDSIKADLKKGIKVLAF